ncbi:efflux RND transporter periplasmic adaptor subunit [Proteobacteria bacterium 005FR1]|nr:efflux RND transporter periplasmic adaptor subunit [Proteobacteria bacterium 005FR1]
MNFSNAPFADFFGCATSDRCRFFRLPARSRILVALLAIALNGCDRPQVTDDHGHAHDPSDAAQDHEHGGGDSLVYTDYTEQTELFVEFSPLVAGQGSTFAAHVTRLADYEPLRSGVLDVVLSQGDKTVARFRVRQPARPGIFTPSVTPRDSGEFELAIEVADENLKARHELGTVTVFPTRDAIEVSQPEPEGDITYLKEQQWVNPFATQVARQRPLRPSVPGFATVLPPADASALLRAAADGYYSSAKLVTAAQKVEAGEILGYIVPRLGAGEDIGQLTLAVERARSRVALARQDVNRLEGLFQRGAVPERRLIEAREDLEVAKVELQTAQSRLDQQAGGKAQAGIALRAPIAGEMTSVNVRPGSYVKAGDALFSIAAPDRRWLDIRVPERFAQNLPEASGAWIEMDRRTLVLDADIGARVVQTDTVIDPRSRTASVTLEYPSGKGPALIGSRFAAHVFSGEAKSILAIPRSAVIDDAGQSVVYVQTSGETFARRPVTLGISDGNYVAVQSGIQQGERVVSQGAYYVKLATIGGDAVGHGHAH